MGMFKNMIKISIDIPYENYTVYPTVSITKDAIINYCIKENIDFEFLKNNSDNNMQVKLDNKLYEILRFNAGRGGYGIKCRPV